MTIVNFFNVFEVDIARNVVLQKFKIQSLIHPRQILAVIDMTVQIKVKETHMIQGFFWIFQILVLRTAVNFLDFFNLIRSYQIINHKMHLAGFIIHQNKGRMNSDDFCPCGIVNVKITVTKEFVVRRWHGFNGDGFCVFGQTLNFNRIVRHNPN